MSEDKMNVPRLHGRTPGRSPATHAGMKAGVVMLIAIFCAAVPPVHAQEDPPLFSKKNLVAWCIVPFDKMKRTPAQRAGMLKELGITQLAYDWRQEHLPSMAEEIRTLRTNHIKLKAVWFWVDGREDKIIDEAGEFVLKTLEENDVRTELWLSFAEGFFAGLTDGEKLDKAAKVVDVLHRKAADIGCSLQLYNHGGWFGEPENQVRIIESLAALDIGIVYNFHHGHDQIGNFPRLLDIMKPYLTTVNINGMRKEGPMILPVGQGTEELAMLKALKASGFKGSIGILSHTDDEDAKVVLRRNLDGLKSLLTRMGEAKALSTY